MVSVGADLWRSDVIVIRRHRDLKLKVPVGVAKEHYLKLRLAFSVSAWVLLCSPGDGLSRLINARLQGEELANCSKHKLEVIYIQLTIIMAITVPMSFRYPCPIESPLEGVVGEYNFQGLDNLRSIVLVES